MAIQGMTPPVQAREGKYQWPDAELKTAAKMLADHRADDNNPPPGDGPYETEGEARSAGNALAKALNEEATAGVRVWVEGKTKEETRMRGEREIIVELGKWFFCLKGARKQYEKNGDNPTDSE